MGYGYKYPYAYMNAAYVEQDRLDQMSREGYLRLIKYSKARIPGYFQRTSLEGMSLSKNGQVAYVNFSVRDYGTYASIYGQDQNSYVMHYHRQCEAKIGQNKHGLEIQEMACDVMPKY